MVKLGSLELKNPVMTASGTFASGKEYGEFFDLSLLGAVVCKTITLKQREGNKPPRIADYSFGMLNAIGLENKGVEYFINNTIPFLKKYDTALVASIAGSDAAEYGELAHILNSVKEIHGVEVNMSCPNVSHGCSKGLFSQDEGTVKEILSAVRARTDKPIFAKISPNVTDITLIAKACENAGADAVSMINTFPAMGVNLKTRRPVLGNVKGGFSGPALKPIALKMVWETYNTIKIPIIGIGGVMNATDALEFILCGASAVQVGTANFVSPTAAADVAKGVEEYFKENKITINDLKGQIKL